ncbi:glycosyltransferase family 4 protein [Pedobacter jeongneungensis]|uniref:glycosyltransferase family 4 protein n=1 Tax=Pedobacter jeongneungensis TaxID=947309 RepID=UPI00046924D4|nr:glycosyltransferase family 1 protein [Pedobacter jeongneungensis]
MIYVNGRFLGNKMDGISRFSLEICKHLKKNGLDFKIVIPKWVEFDNDEGFDIVKFGSSKSHFWEQLDLLKFLKKNGTPLLLNLSGLGPLWYNRKIVTIHDLSFIENPKWFSRWYFLFYSITTPIIAKHSLKIITVSEFSKGEIVRLMKVDAGKVEVVYNAVTKSKEPISSERESGLYVLGVSSLDPRKNFKRLIDAFKLDSLKNVKLIIVGKAGNHFMQDFSAQNTSNVQFEGYVGDVALNKLYHNASAFVYPSLYEGFGIPPLEAMSHGCPVIVSDIKVLREVCGNAARYIDPLSSTSIAQELTNLLNNDALRSELIQNGYSQIEKFSWDTSSKKIINILNQYK